MTSNELLSRLARLGAARRLQELQDETNEILREFPELGRGTQTSAPGAAEPAVSTGRRRTRRKMTAAEKKAVGERMRKYWAARRKQAAAK